MQLLLPYILCFGMLLVRHPFHVSVTDVHFNEKAHTLEITHRIFLDDLEKAMKRKFGEGIDLLNITDHQKVDKMVSSYINEHFSIKINSTEKKAKYLGKEVEEDAMWVYREVPNISNMVNIQIKNTLLFEVFDDQINLVHVEKGDKIKSLKLTTDKKQGSVRFGH